MENFWVSKSIIMKVKRHIEKGLLAEKGERSDIQPAGPVYGACGTVPVGV